MDRASIINASPLRVSFEKSKRIIKSKDVVDENAILFFSVEKSLSNEVDTIDDAQEENQSPSNVEYDNDDVQ